MTTVEPEESDLLSAFRLIDEQLAAAPQAENLVVFRERLIAELVGDADRVAATLAPDFSLVTHVGGKTLTSGRDQLVASIQRLGAAPGGALMWLRLESLVADRTTVAGHGFLVTLTAAPVSVTVESSTRADVALWIVLSASAIPIATMFKTITAQRWRTLASRVSSATWS